MKWIPALMLALALAACKEEEASAPPPPVELTETALSFYCQMDIAEHGGPKGQIHLSGFDNPLFFAQARDLVAYLKSPERDAAITAVYVSDMDVAPNWAQPGKANWIAAENARFVVGANVAGGMGAPEIVPFGTQAGADAFVVRYGGVVMALQDIPEEAAFGPVDLDIPLETPS